MRWGWGAWALQSPDYTPCLCWRWVTVGGREECPHDKHTREAQTPAELPIMPSVSCANITLNKKHTIGKVYNNYIFSKVILNFKKYMFKALQNLILLPYLEKWPRDWRSGRRAFLLCLSSLSALLGLAWPHFLIRLQIPLRESGLSLLMLWVWRFLLKILVDAWVSNWIGL